MSYALFTKIMLFSFFSSDLYISHFSSFLFVNSLIFFIFLNPFIYFYLFKQFMQTYHFLITCISFFLSVILLILVILRFCQKNSAFPFLCHSYTFCVCWSFLFRNSFILFTHTRVLLIFLLKFTTKCIFITYFFNNVVFS